MLGVCGPGGTAGRGAGLGRGQVERGRGHGAPDLSEVWKFACQPVALGAGVDPPRGNPPGCPDYLRPWLDPLGEDCELDTEAGRCVPGVCRNGGTCADGPDGGFRCQCPAGGAFEGPRCEVSARSFPPSSFVMFRGLRQRFHLTLSLS